MLYLYIILSVAILGFLVYASCSIRAGIYLKSICRLNTDGYKNADADNQSLESYDNRKSLFLSFDDGPSPIQTQKVLHVLKQHNIKALFFIIGQNAVKYPEVASAIIEDGHLIGSHSYSHTPVYPLWNYKQIKTDLEMGCSVVDKLLEYRDGKKTALQSKKLFRPPFGVTNPAIARAVKELKLTSIGWSIRSFDTKYNLTLSSNRDKVIRNITNKLKPGAIILLHDRLDGSDLLLQELIAQINSKGYRIADWKI